MGGRAEPQLALGFGQRDVEAFLAGARALHQELERDRGLPGPGRALDQKHVLPGEPAGQDIVQAPDAAPCFTHNRLDQDVASQTEINSQRVQAVPSQRNLFLGGWQGCRSPVDRTLPDDGVAKRRGLQSAGSVQRARHSGSRFPQPLGWVSKHCAPGAGCNHGCARRIEKCATGISHDVSSSVSARRLTASGRPSRSP